VAPNRERLQPAQRWGVPPSRLCIALLIAALFTGVWGGTHDAAPTSGVTATAALGDSVPYGTACACMPYPELTAGDIARAVGHEVSADVVTELQRDASVMSRVAQANVVIVETGANDVAHSASCGNMLACYEPELPAVQRNLDSIVTRIHALAGDHEVTVVLVDYWSVWLGGSYAHAQGPAYVAAADALTAEVDTVVSTVAYDTRSIYVDLRTAFRGPDQDGDETGLLASDGEHPNAEGQETIAQAIERSVRAT
jgi:lysophospholipase L1-like esterase